MANNPMEKKVVLISNALALEKTSPYPIEEIQIKKEDIKRLENIYLKKEEDTLDMGDIKEWINNYRVDDKEQAKRNAIFLELKNTLQILVYYTFSESYYNGITFVINRFMKEEDKDDVYFVLRECCTCKKIFPLLEWCKEKNNINNLECQAVYCNALDCLEKHLEEHHTSNDNNK